MCLLFVVFIQELENIAAVLVKAGFLTLRKSVTFQDSREAVASV